MLLSLNIQECHHIIPVDFLYSIKPGYMKTHFSNPFHTPNSGSWCTCCHRPVCKATQLACCLYRYGINLMVIHSQVDLHRLWVFHLLARILRHSSMHQFHHGGDQGAYA